MSTETTVTQLLELASAGDPTALDRVFPLVYEELRTLAQRQLRNESEGHTLNSGALVHEAYFRLVGQTRTHWRDRAHFMAVAARSMRRILIDHARRLRAVRRGGGWDRLTIEGVDVLSADPPPNCSWSSMLPSHASRPSTKGRQASSNAASSAG